MTVRKLSDARSRALRTFAQGAAFSGFLAVPQAVSALSGGPVDLRLMAATAVQAFGTGVLSYVHRKTESRKAQ